MLHCSLMSICFQTIYYTLNMPWKDMAWVFVLIIPLQGNNYMDIFYSTKMLSTIITTVNMNVWQFEHAKANSQMIIAKDYITMRESIWLQELQTYSVIVTMKKMSRQGMKADLKTWKKLHWYFYTHYLTIPFYHCDTVCTIKISALCIWDRGRARERENKSKTERKWEMETERETENLRCFDIIGSQSI